MSDCRDFHTPVLTPNIQSDHRFIDAASAHQFLLAILLNLSYVFYVCFASLPPFYAFFNDFYFLVSVHLKHGLLNYRDTEAQCCHLKNLPVKGLCGRCL